MSSPVTLDTRDARDAYVDPRGLRFSATVTSVVLASVLVLPSPAREIVLAAQTLVFALGAFVALSASPYAKAFATLIRPRLAPPSELEDAAAPRYAQAVGFVFAAAGLVGLLAGLTTVGLIAVAAALVAALLNATTGFCLGCEMYLIARRAARGTTLLS